MTDSYRVLKGRLLRALGSAASYNDKGCIWSGHSESRQELFRAELQAEISQLAEHIGQDTLGPDLYGALKSGIAVRDSSGDFLLLVRSCLGVENGL